MEDILLTVKDLSEKWKKDEKTIRKYIEDGIVKTCKGVPGVRFHPKHIAELEGVEREKFSLLEKRKMQQRIDELEAIVKLQNEQLRKVAAIGTESMMVLQKVMQ